LKYCFQVPANRWGNLVYSASQLKIIQEVITLAVFVVFAIFYLARKSVELRRGVVCILAAVGLRVFAEGLTARTPRRIQKINHGWTQMDTDSRTESGSRQNFIRVYPCPSVV